MNALLQLARRARHSASVAELNFVAVNETHGLAPYRQAALWLRGRGVTALSGIVAPEANAPFVHWLDRIAKRLARDAGEGPTVVEPHLLDAADAVEWEEWLPAQGLWLPLHDFNSEADGGSSAGGLLLAREAPWHPGEMQLLAEWADIWSHAWAKLNRPPRLSFRHWARGVPRSVWRSRFRNYGLIALACALIPVRLTVVAPGELVPAQPTSIRAPLDGTVERFFVAPNAAVKAGAPLFQLDLTALSSKLEVARQGLASAEAEYRQYAQQAVFDARSKSQLAQLQGRISEYSAEVDYYRAQFSRAQVTAPRDGVVLVDDPSEWVGKPVSAGERVMTIADPTEVEVEAWLMPADLIDLEQEAAVTLYLNASPLNPVKARLRYAAHEALPRPDGSYAYRMRAVLEEGQERVRVGLKGTAKVAGAYVPAVYWLLRRPLATLRPLLGI